MVIGALVLLSACTDHAKPDYDKCVLADTAGDVPGALVACANAIKIAPSSKLGKTAAAKIADIEQRKAAIAAADERARAALSSSGTEG